MYLNDKDKYHQVVEVTVKTSMLKGRLKKKLYIFQKKLKSRLDLIFLGLVNDNEDEYTGRSNGGNVATGCCFLVFSH